MPVAHPAPTLRGEGICRFCAFLSKEFGYNGRDMIRLTLRAGLIGVALVIGTAVVAEAMEQLATARADDPPKPASPSSTAPAGNKTAEKSRTPPNNVDRLKLPSGAVLVLGEEVADALRLLPKAVVLTPEKYQELMDQLEQLKRLARPERPESPSSCRLSGQLEGDLVRLKAQFEFRTDKPKTLVTLGCQRAWPTAASLADGQIPQLVPTDDGWQVLVETPGTHQLTVDLVQQLTTKGTKGTERGVDIGLPRAAITVLERFDLPGNIPDVRVAGRTVRTKKIDSPEQSRLEGIVLGPADKLELAWRSAPPEVTKGQPLLTSRARIVVRVEEAYVFTDVELTLEVLRHETAVWRIYAPLAPQATLEKPQLQDERIQSIDRQNAVLTIRLKEASAEPLKIQLQFRQPRLGTPVAVGPFVVLDALPQGGTIEIRAPQELRLRYHPHGEISQREVTEDQRRDNVVALFAYWNLSAKDAPRQAVAAPITFEVEPIKGAVEMRTIHAIRFLEETPDGRSSWRVTTRMDATALRTGVDRLEVQLPVNYQYDRSAGSSPAELVEDVQIDPATRIAQVKLAQKQFRSFSITLPGIVNLDAGRGPASQLHEAAIELPAPLSWGVDRASESERRWSFLDHGGQVSVMVPQGMEIIPRRPASEVPPPGARELSWNTERAPMRAEWAWRAYRPELRVESILDVSLAERQGRIRHQLRFHQAQIPAGEISLRVPNGLLGPVEIVQGGKIVPHEGSTTPGTVTVRLGEPAENEHVVTLTYAFSHDRRHVELPVLHSEQATVGESRIRFWTEPGVVPTLAGGAWEELATEVVPERSDRLPALVVRGNLGTPLSLHLVESPAMPLASAVVERALLRGTIGRGGAQIYQARFLLTRVNARILDLVFPAPPARVNFNVALDGKQVPFQVVDESGKEAEIGRTIRLRVEPDLYRKPVVLDVGYQLDAGQVGGNGYFQTTLYPPTLVGAVFLGRVRWAIELPPRRLPLPLHNDAVWEQHWDWLGWLLAPRPAATGLDLERWFAGAEPPAALDPPEPGLVGWQATLGPVRVVHVAQQVWLVTCSLVFLLFGLALSLTYLPRVVFWSLVMLLGTGLALTGILFPDALPALVYGCELGLVVLVLVLGAQWMVQQRYRRQVVFMPGFSRLKPGSSLIRPVPNRPREPSTVDSPSKRIGPTPESQSSS